MLLLKKNCPFIIILFALSIVSTIKTIAQANIGIGTGTPNASALLDVSATNKGLLIPRMTSAQMIGIASPADGLLVYNTDAAAFAYRTAGAWVFLKGNTTADNNWSTKGNLGTGPFYLGTLNNADLVFIRNSDRAGLLSDKNTGMGVHSLDSVSTGQFNTAVGWSALESTTTGGRNTANGYGAMRFNTTGDQNSAFGMDCLRSSNGNFNAGFGNAALQSTTTGSYNTAVGYASLGDNNIGSQNAAFGYNSLVKNHSSSNTGMGYAVLQENMNGGGNTAVGFQSGFFNLGNTNVFIGYQAGYNETGSNKLYINNSDADSASSLLYGEFDNKLLSIGGKLGIGRLPAGFPLEIKSQSVNGDLVKFYNDTNIPKWHLKLLNNGAFNFTETNVADYRLVLNPGGEVGIGKITGTTSNDSRLQIKQKGSQNGLGIEAAGYSNHWDFYVTEAANSALAYYYNGVNKGNFSPADGAYVMVSDRRYKKDMVPQADILPGLLQLQPMQYHYTDNSPTDKMSTGFIAQDVQKIFPDAVSEIVQKDGTTSLGIKYQYFTVLAVKGLQEQESKIIAMQEQIKTLVQEIEKLKAK